jgi:hypothetical protein
MRGFRVRKAAIRLRLPLRGFGYQVKLNCRLTPRGYLWSSLRGYKKMQNLNLELSDKKTPVC